MSPIGAFPRRPAEAGQILPQGTTVLRRPTAAIAPVQDDALEALFVEGAARYAQGNVEGAHESFVSAQRRRPADPRGLAWYGLTLILVEHNNNLGVRYCEEAVRGAGAALPLGWLNLGRAFMALGYRVRALRALQRGLELDPFHPEFAEELARLGVRRQPVVGFLARSNPLNRLLGRLRNRTSRR